MANAVVQTSPKARKSLKGSKSINQAIIIIMLGLGSLAMIIPFWWMLATSFDADALFDVVFPPRFWPGTFTLDNYILAFTNVPLARYMINTVTIAIGNITISILSAMMAGYALSKIQFKGKNVILLIALSTMMIPGEVTMTARFYLFNRLGLTDTYWAFWLPAFAYVFGTFFTKQYMDAIPNSLRESARLDGAGELRIALQIYMPLCGALTATLVVLLFLGTWNDFLWPLIILTSPSKYTLQLGVAMFTYNQGINVFPALRLATTVISIIPILILYTFLQRYIVESIALSGVKQ